MNPKFKGELHIKRGHWWALVALEGKIQTWAPIGSVGSLGPMKDVVACARLAYWYQCAGILDTITGPIIICDDEKILEVKRGTLSEEEFAKAQAAA